MACWKRSRTTPWALVSTGTLFKKYGQHLKRGVLLYGRPGTGKTHTVRYLLSRGEGATAILLSGGSLARISEAATMARALQPSIVVLEDCDLIAEDRSFGHGPQPLLFEVLDAMDGLANDADVAFVLTTNRVDMLERALAQRPGRVDLAVEIPLPAQAERVSLLRLYARGISFSPEALEDAAAGTEGTTASFARELIRRAVVAAALEHIPVADSHLAKAVDDLMADSAALTRSLLGSGSGGGTGGDADGHGGVPAFPGPPGSIPLRGLGTGVLRNAGALPAGDSAPQNQRWIVFARARTLSGSITLTFRCRAYQALRFRSARSSRSPSPKPSAHRPRRW